MLRVEASAINFEPGQLALIQSDEQFIAPDGTWRNSVLGPVSVIAAKDLFGFEPKHGTNWYAQIGSGERAVLIAGCRIHYCLPALSDAAITKLVAQNYVWDAR